MIATLLFTITIKWWIFPLILILIPFVYSYFREPAGWWDIPFDTMIIGAGCWSAAAGIILGHFL